MHGAGAHLQHEQRIQAVEPDRVEVEEVRRQELSGLSSEKRAPFLLGPPPWRGPEPGLAQHPADGGRTEPVPEPTQLPVHTPIPPKGIFAPEPENQIAHLFTERGTPGMSAWVHLRDQPSVPGEQRARRHDSLGAQPARQHPSENREHRAVRPRRLRNCDLTAQHRNTRVFASLVACDRASNTSHANIREASR